MNNDDRRALYLRDRTDLTPAQSRRLRHKENAANSERVTGKLGRFARLRRRFERKDRREVKARAAWAVWWLRVNRDAKRGNKAASEALRTYYERKHEDEQRRVRQRQIRQAFDKEEAKAKAKEEAKA